MLSFRAVQGRGGPREIGRVANHLPVAQHDGPPRVPCDLLIVGHHDDGDPVFLVELSKQVHDFPAGLRVEIARRLVGQKDRRFVGHGAGDGHALLLAAGKLRGMVVHARFQAHLFQQLPHAFAPLAAAEPPE